MCIHNEYTTYRYTGIRSYMFMYGYYARIYVITMYWFFINSRKNTLELDLFVNFGWNWFTRYQFYRLKKKTPVYWLALFLLYTGRPLTQVTFCILLDDPCRSLNNFEAIEFLDQIPPGSLTARPWNYTIPKGKDRLPTILFQGRKC